MAILTSISTLVLPTSFGDFLSKTFQLWLLWYLVSGFFAYRRLRHIPGPRVAAFTSLWWTVAAFSEKGHLVLAGVNNRFGPIARVAPNVVTTDDLEFYRQTNSSKDLGFRRGQWYKAFKLDAVRNNLFSETNEEQHAKTKQKIAHGYSGRDNPALEPTIDDVVLSLVRLVKEKYLSRGTDLKPLPFADISQYFTLDVITHLSLGEPFGFVSEDTDKYEWSRSLENYWPIFNLCAHVPFLSYLTTLPMVQKLLLPKVTDEVGMGKVKAIARGIISRRFHDEKVERHDMVLSFKKHGLSEEEIADESLMQLLAGSDTTATAIRTGMLSIIGNPEICNRLRAEISDYVEKTSLPLEDVISYSSALKLPYLQACIKEALRHHPPATGPFPRVVGPEGATCKGVYLPPGTEIFFTLWNVHRMNTSLYGADAATFRPERWLEASPEQLARMEEGTNMVFGYGRFRCVGENIARMELNKTWFELLRRFDWSLVNPQNPFTKNANYGLFVQKGILMKVESRD